MFLIFAQYLDEFSQNLDRVAREKGLDTILLTSAQVATDLTLVYRLSCQDMHLQLQHGDTHIESGDIEAVYCGINTFEPNIWISFTSEDAEYAARETQAVWLSILTSLSSKMVNPPAMDSLAGTVLSTPELMYLAQQFGFQIPMVINLESGKIAAELLSSGVSARYTNLGEPLTHEGDVQQICIGDLQESVNHFRVLEIPPGKSIYLTVSGQELFASEVEADASVRTLDIAFIPAQIQSRLHALQDQLNLHLAEYAFRVTPSENWVFCDCQRLPLVGVAAYGDMLFAQIVDRATGQGG